MREPGGRFTPTRADPPLQVVEMRATGDPWRVLVACICLVQCNRNAVDRIWPELLGSWPTAEAMAGANAVELEATLRPIGLQRSRAQKLWSMSAEWLRWREEGLDVSWRDVERLPGCGQYAAEAYRVFVVGELAQPAADRVVETWRRLVMFNPELGVKANAEPLETRSA